MTLRDYYNELSDKEKAEFRDKVIKKTGRNMTTYYRWLNDCNRPSYNDQKAIARVAGVPVRELFPEKELV
jgi:hypothetical protein